jgi:hypothetical protein
MFKSSNNGRVDVEENDNYEMYNLFKQNSNYKNDQASVEAIKNIHSKNPLSDIFFSPQNMNYLHDAIRYMVYEKSCKKHIIDKQSETDLFIIMRSIYLQYGEHKPYGIKDQVKELNTLVLNYCVPKILEEIKIYLHYRKDIASLPVPMDRGEFISAKGTKILEQKF